ncbi:transcriptional regulator containing an amidase domain and an AraC-type DNA-binding HTH domain [Galbibacter orientalis DSM 19592]|uniref:Transcriptional regulator containing an amidase domain and an AraC-type DNA-binding HTH domain n=1 Tax=Galbibacter orientalis DSM 19592 TaxID=926559 RepID=I3CAV3_9FLAO|nr:AraC family transcriptional regulator [Galbibacter orientalis]EIJ40746.1 transcriptional regulator containing an amidase domain and an AraC-type DNA-binding HTH domain [Galbibacter orientalis DSM 19592]
MNKLLQSLQLTLLNIGYASLNRNWNFDKVYSPFSRLYYITEGNAQVYHNNTVYHLKKDHLYLIPSYTNSRYYCDNFMEQYYISFLEEMLDGSSIYHLRSFLYEIPAQAYDLILFKRLLQINPARTISRDDPKIYDNDSSLITFIDANNKLSASSYLETKGILLNLLSRFIKDKEPNENKHIPDIRLAKVNKYIRENLNEPLSVLQLANFCCLHPDYFSRIFKEEFKVRPISYINNLRIERAQLLLVTTSSSIPEIAEKVGLSNLSYFSRLFKKQTQKSPLEFRKQEWKLK